MRNAIWVLTLMSVGMFFTTETKGQENEEIAVLQSFYSSPSVAVEVPAEWYIGVSPQVLISYNVKSEEENKYSQNLIVNLELGRASGKWYNAVGYNPLNRAMYSLNVYTVAKWRFPLQLFSYGEYSWKKTDGVPAGGFMSVGPLTKVANESCIVALTFGTPTANWQPSIGVLVVIPFMTQLNGIHCDRTRGVSPRGFF